MNNTCVCCGKVIPEGRQICPTCGDTTNKNLKSNNSEIMRNKQVEELATYLSQFTPILSENNCHYVAEQAYKDGYRRQGELAREVFTEIERIINRYCKDYKYSIADVLLDITELRKKYTKGQENQ